MCEMKTTVLRLILDFRKKKRKGSEIIGSAKRVSVEVGRKFLICSGLINC